MGVLEAGKGQAEVIKSAVEKLAGNGDAEIGHFREVRQSHPARRMLLAKDDLPIRTVHARQARMRRSRVRRVLSPRSGCRRQSSPKTAIGLSPGAAFNIGTTSLSQTSAKGSARRRSRRAFFWLGSRGSVSNR